MTSLLAFMKKEWMEGLRSGKIMILFILFLLFGIMNPAIAKLTPWMMQTMAQSLAEAGFAVTEVQVDAFISWAQFFKNIPIGLIVFILIYSNTFTKEYQSCTLTLVLTKGLARFKVILAKSAIMLFVWTACYWLCFAVTYGYNSYFWDNSIVNQLFAAAVLWWLFGIWTISLLVFCSALFRNNSGVLLGTGGSVLAAYLAGMFPQTNEYAPTMLTNISSLLYGTAGTDIYRNAVIVTIAVSVICLTVSIPILNKKQL